MSPCGTEQALRIGCLDGTRCGREATSALFILLLDDSHVSELEGTSAGGTGTGTTHWHAWTTIPSRGPDRYGTVRYGTICEVHTVHCVQDSAELSQASDYRAPHWQDSLSWVPTARLGCEHVSVGIQLGRAFIFEGE